MYITSAKTMLAAKDSEFKAANGQIRSQFDGTSLINIQ